MKRPQPPHDRQILATRPGLGLFRGRQQMLRIHEQHEHMKRAIQERFKPSIRIVQPLAPVTTITRTVH